MVNYVAKLLMIILPVFYFILFIFYNNIALLKVYKIIFPDN